MSNSMNSDEALERLRHKLHGKPYSPPGTILAKPGQQNAYKSPTGIAAVTADGIVVWISPPEGSNRVPWDMVDDGLDSSLTWLSDNGYVVIREGWEGAPE